MGKREQRVIDAAKLVVKEWKKNGRSAIFGWPKEELTLARAVDALAKPRNARRKHGR